jgi:hypothetical protein
MSKAHRYAPGSTKKIVAPNSVGMEVEPFQGLLEPESIEKVLKVNAMRLLAGAIAG